MSLCSCRYLPELSPPPSIDKYTGSQLCSFRYLPDLPSSPSPTPPPLKTNNNHTIDENEEISDPFLFIDGEFELEEEDNDYIITESEDEKSEKSEKSFSYLFGYHLKGNGSTSISHSRPSSPSRSYSMLSMNDFFVDHILCDSIEQCIPFKRIIENLKIYQMIENNKIDDIALLQRLNNSLLDDYHHIIIEHLCNKPISEINQSFNTLNKMLLNVINCNFNKCSSVQRYYRIREKTNRTTQQLRGIELQFYIDIMDTIHNYFIHSFDLGMRVKFNKLNYNNDDYQEQHYHDQQIKTIKRRLNQLNIRRNRHKFFTQLNLSNNNESPKSSKSPSPQSTKSPSPPNNTGLNRFIFLYTLLLLVIFMFVLCVYDMVYIIYIYSTSTML